MNDTEFIQAIDNLFRRRERLIADKVAITPQYHQLMNKTQNEMTPQEKQLQKLIENFDSFLMRGHHYDLLRNSQKERLFILSKGHKKLEEIKKLIQKMNWTYE